jgi:hypothetical protein
MRPTRLIVEHFKILDHADLTLAPITILIGGNNAGKSSALHAPAVLGQSVNSDKNKVVSRGSYLDLGDPPSVLTNRSSKTGEGWTIRVTWTDSHPADHRVAPGRPILISFRCTAGTPEQLVFTEGIVEFEAPAGRKVSARSWYSAVGPRFEVDADRYVARGANLPAVSEAVTNLAQQGTFGSLPYPVGPDADSQFEARDVTDPQLLMRYTQAISAPYFTLLIPSSLGMIRYLGVERNFTQSAYHLSDQAPPFPMEQHGLASVIAYDRELRRAVDERCREMFGFGVSADFAAGRNIDLVGVAPDGEQYSLNSMGAGFGQILWMLVFLELQRRWAGQSAGPSRPTPLICIEEAELHLHPGAQPAAAKLLTSYALTGVQQMITTQSEHLLIAFLQQVTTGQLRNTDLAVYYMAGGHAERLEVDEIGRLSGGLKGFFEANESELLEQLRALIHPSDA